MNQVDHRDWLVSNVLYEWQESDVRPPNEAKARKMAKLAVDEIVDALRYNPRWALSLGIGAD